MHCLFWFWRAFKCYPLFFFLLVTELVTCFDLHFCSWVHCVRISKLSSKASGKTSDAILANLFINIALCKFTANKVRIPCSFSHSKQVLLCQQWNIVLVYFEMLAVLFFKQWKCITKTPSASSAKSWEQSKHVALDGRRWQWWWTERNLTLLPTGRCRHPAARSTSKALLLSFCSR